MYLKDNNYKFALNKNKTGYSFFYEQWREILFDYAMKIFSWEGLPDTLPAKEIEVRLLLYGMAGVHKLELNNELVVSDVNLFGLTNYYDDFTSYTYTTPLESGTKRIDKDGILISNNSLRNGLFQLIHGYSVQLAHCDTSLVCALINGRDVALYKAVSDKMAMSIRAYRAQVVEGKPDVLVDNGFVTTEIEQLNADKTTDVSKLMDLRNNLLNSFFENIGIRRANEKRERMIVDEVSANNGLLKVNLQDMFQCRKEAAEKINNMFGLNIKPVCNVDIDGDGIPSVDIEKEGVIDENNI